MASRWIAVGVLLLCSGLVPSMGRAQADEVRTGVRLGLSADLFAFERRSVSLGGTSTTSEAFAFGLTAPRLGIDVGGFVSPQFGLGVRGGLAGATSSTSAASGESSGALAYHGLAYVEGRFVVASPVAVMLRGELGASGTHGGQLSFDAFAIGAQLGLHLHPVGAFSISPFLGFEYAIGGGHVASRSGGLDGFTISVGITTFGWIATGDAAIEEEADDEVSEPEAHHVFAPVETAPGEPSRTSSGWRVEMEFIGAEATVTLPTTGSVAQLELRLGSVTARFEACYEATFVVGDRTARMQALGTATASASGVDERVVLTGWREGLDVLTNEGAHIELCGVVLEPTAAGREALSRLLSRAAE